MLSFFFFPFSFLLRTHRVRIVLTSYSGKGIWLFSFFPSFSLPGRELWIKLEDEAIGDYDWDYVLEI
jgi:hypothetical protein